jgi:hypothetical protein
MSNELYSTTPAKNILELYKDYQKQLYPNISSDELTERILYATAWLTHLLNTKNNAEKVNS